jgi:hypothetical protein
MRLVGDRGQHGPVVDGTQREGLISERVAATSLGFGAVVEVEFSAFPQLKG